MLTAIIVDDVSQARKTLKEDLETYCPEVEVIGEAEGVVSAAKLLKNTHPDVLFLDIQMQDGSGFDLLEVLGEIKFNVIFTTASDAYAIKAFRFSAVDYLMKPIDPDELMEAVRKAHSAPAPNQDHVDLLLSNVKGNKNPTRLAINTLEKVHVVKLDEILRCESSANYTIFYLANKRQLLATKTLKEFDNLLSEADFIRVHQSHLVNAAYIKEFVKVDGGYIVMSDGTNVPVSTRKRSSVIQMMSDL
ncbi:MAG: response regulator transcription factor [Bacteroidetes bacterium]|nr:response regulator transcription factor [Bacteroidota bacterium]MCB0854289.1 response regulator transcription factor [Bacteroidota bacterium]